MMKETTRKKIVGVIGSLVQREILKNVEINRGMKRRLTKFNEQWC